MGIIHLNPFGSAGDERLERSDVRGGDRPSGASFASRSFALGCSGAAATAHPLATLTAIETLQRGGSAVDAAPPPLRPPPWTSVERLTRGGRCGDARLAAGACLGFLEPTGSGLGG